MVNQNHGAAKLLHQCGAGVQHGLGVLCAVLITRHKAVQGVNRNDAGLDLDGAYGFQHPQVAFWRV